MTSKHYETWIEFPVLNEGLEDLHMTYVYFGVISKKQVEEAEKALQSVMPEGFDVKPTGTAQLGSSNVLLFNSYRLDGLNFYRKKNLSTVYSEDFPLWIPHVTVPEKIHASDFLDTVFHFGPPVLKFNLVGTARVILFREGGKYYTEEEWRIPEKAIGPYGMANSPDFRRIDGGKVLVVTQEPWGYPHLL